MNFLSYFSKKKKKRLYGKLPFSFSWSSTNNKFKLLDRLFGSTLRNEIEHFGIEEVSSDLRFFDAFFLDCDIIFLLNCPTNLEL